MNLTKQMKEDIRFHAVTCIAQIIDAVREEGGDPFLVIAERNMTSLVKQVLRRKQNARSRGV